MNLPAAFISRISNQLGIETEAFMEALRGEPLTSLRFHRQKGQPENSRLPLQSPVKWHSRGYYLSERPSFTADPWFHAGAYYVQEASSMLLKVFLEPENYKYVLDACAAPGGKTTLLLDALPETSVVVANEVIKSRAGILAENLTRWGYPNVIVTSGDPAAFSGFINLFDLIVTDAPCSGEGMFRKDKNSVTEWTPENVAICAARQKRILSDLVPALASGGHLIYSTCTYAPEENAQTIEHFLTKNPDMELCPLNLPEYYGATSISILGIPTAAWQCFPHKCAGEGFFICKMRKKGEKKQPDTPFPKQKKNAGNTKSSKVFGNFDKKNTSELTALLSTKMKKVNPNAIRFGGEYVFYLSPEIDDILTLFEKLSIVRKGTLLGKMQGKEFVPAHEFALSTLISPEVPFIELSYDAAIQYLMKNDIENCTDYHKGWITARFQGVNLGWIKVAGNRLKNHFPIHWRIRNL